MKTDNDFTFTRPEIEERIGKRIVPSSFRIVNGTGFWLQRIGDQAELGILTNTESSNPGSFPGTREPFIPGWEISFSPRNEATGWKLIELLPNLTPVPLGLATSAGFGDRLGMATPGHARALQSSEKGKSIRVIKPIFAQQSIREMKRTNRTPSQVLIDATWGAFEAGWTGQVGADADHLKTLADVDWCASAGFTFFTIDPSEQIDYSADNDTLISLRDKLTSNPIAEMDLSAVEAVGRYSGKRFDLGEHYHVISEEEAVRAMAKFIKVINQIVKIYTHLVMSGKPFEIEISIDEAPFPTSLTEHFILASELKRLGVTWVSLAPRFVGRFEKGVDYIGDLDQLRQNLLGHVNIAQLIGPYKISIHSGSDKFSIYPLFSELTHGLVHLKTAGTSFVEAIRVVAKASPQLFSEIYEFSRSCYETDRVSYHVSADLTRVPNLRTIGSQDLAGLIDLFDVRQMIHVAFGSILGHYKKDLTATIQGNIDLYYAILEEHFRRHLIPFESDL
jgi:tagaturonate epimerase